MDFDDMLVYTWLLFKNHPDIAKKYQEKFKYILVDEYQDTNYAQHQIVLLLTGNQQHVCVVGDDAQSIYSFRGAKIDNILNFQKFFSGVKLFKLEQNYRSTQTIVSAANSLIHHNVQQIRKDVYSKGDVGEPIEVCKAYSDVDEANIVVRKIRNLVAKENLKYSETAILYRTNAQSRSLEDALRKQNIPYRIYGGTSFYQRK
jgi:DNA helicase-2/ATP-dependent DNA helicase PcrA